MPTLTKDQHISTGQKLNVGSPVTTVYVDPMITSAAKLFDKKDVHYRYNMTTKDAVNYERIHPHTVDALYDELKRLHGDMEAQRKPITTDKIRINKLYLKKELLNRSIPSKKEEANTTFSYILAQGVTPLQSPLKKPSDKSKSSKFIVSRAPVSASKFYFSPSISPKKGVTEKNISSISPFNIHKSKKRLIQSNILLTSLNLK